MNLRWTLGLTAGLMGAGMIAGYKAQEHGVAQDQIRPWLVKAALRRALGLYDRAVDMMPGERAVPLARALDEEPPAGTGGGGRA